MRSPELVLARTGAEWTNAPYLVGLGPWASVDVRIAPERTHRSDNDSLGQEHLLHH